MSFINNLLSNRKEPNSLLDSQQLNQTNNLSSQMMPPGLNQGNLGGNLGLGNLDSIMNQGSLSNQSGVNGWQIADRVMQDISPTYGQARGLYDLSTSLMGDQSNINQPGINASMGTMNQPSPQQLGSLQDVMVPPANDRPPIQPLPLQEPSTSEGLASYDPVEGGTWTAFFRSLLTLGMGQ